jgi:hypothetical protein
MPLALFSPASRTRSSRPGGSHLGVMPALDAVLAEPDLQRADRIVLTGDIAAGPQPTEVLDRLLSPDHVDWLAGLPYPVTLTVDGFGGVVFCHATPRDNLPFTRLANTRQIINPGSVGMPYGRQGAHWAILSGGAVKMHRTAYDPVAACALAVMAPRDGRA